MKSCLLVLDIGLNQCQVAAISQDYHIIKQASKALQIQNSQPGEWAMDATQLWNQVQGLLSDLVKQLADYKIEGLTLTSSVNGTVVWDKETSSPIHPALTNKDKQAIDSCKLLKKDRKEPMIHFRSGLFAEPTLPGTQLSWILNHVDSARARAQKGELGFGTIITWILWQLTGGVVHAIDAAAASQTLLFDLSTYKWETQLLAAFNVPGSMMPKVGQSNEYYGETLGSLFGQSIPITTLTNQNSATLYALAIRDPEQLQITYGHDLNIQLPRGYAPNIVPLMNTSIAWVMEGHSFFRMSSRLPGLTPSVQWLKRMMALPSSLDELSTLAEQAELESKLVMVPTFDGYGTPFFDPDARSAIMGLDNNTGQPEIAQALLESMALQSLQVLEIIEKTTKRKVHTIYANTESGQSDWLMQRQADLATRPVHCYHNQPLAWYGAAAMTWEKIADKNSLNKLKDILAKPHSIFQPQMDAPTIQQKRHLWGQAFEAAKGWASL